MYPATGYEFWHECGSKCPNISLKVLGFFGMDPKLDTGVGTTIC